MDKQIKLIDGDTYKDTRGTLKFINDFDLKEIRRVYSIEPNDTDFIRAWQGHKEECKYFLVTQGSFTIGLVQVDNWDSPSKTIQPTYYKLEAENPKVLCVPGGYANGIKSNIMNSKLMVFSTSPLEEARHDEFRFLQNYWEFRP